MDTTNIVQVPPIESVARIGATVRLPVLDAMKFLRAIAHDSDGGSVIDWLEAERLRISNAATARVSAKEDARRRARGEQ